MLMLLVAITFALELVSAASAQDIPRFGMAVMCHTTDRTDSCVQAEEKALAELQAEWSKLPASARPQCIREMDVGGPPSYTELLVCLQMAEWQRSQPVVEPEKEPEITGSISKHPSPKPARPVRTKH